MSTNNLGQRPDSCLSQLEPRQPAETDTAAGRPVPTRGSESQRAADNLRWCPYVLDSARVLFTPPDTELLLTRTSFNGHHNLACCRLWMLVFKRYLDSRYSISSVCDVHLHPPPVASWHSEVGERLAMKGRFWFLGERATCFCSHMASLSVLLPVVQSNRVYRFRSTAFISGLGHRTAYWYSVCNSFLQTKLTPCVLCSVVKWCP